MANAHTKEILTRPEKVGKMAAIMSVFVKMDKQENTDVLTSGYTQMRRIWFVPIRKVCKKKIYVLSYARVSGTLMQVNICLILI